MILLADSGTTKCDWIFIDNQRHDKHFIINTPGLNPTYFTENEIKGIINSSNDILSIKSHVEKIYFFGSGCGNQEVRKKMVQTLKGLFYKATEIKVLSDIEGAVYASTTEPAVVGILGTGSNCCYFDGKDIQIRVPSLGYILMDDGGGNAIGKACLRAFLYKRMPQDLAEAFGGRYKTDPERLKERIYHHPQQSAFLASFAPFVFENIKDPFMHALVEKEIEAFFDNALPVYEKELSQVKLHFIGSIAHHAEDIIQKMCEDKGYTLGKVLGRPVKELARQLDHFINQL